MILASPGRIVESDDLKVGIEELLAAASVNKDGKGDGSGTIPDEVITRGLGGYSFGDVSPASAIPPSYRSHVAPPAFPCRGPTARA